jgi:Ca2+-dependent lipid-binding protein
MDPYCVLQVRQDIFKTAVKQDAGKTPVWNQTFDVLVHYIGDDFTIKVMDEDVTSADAIGSFEAKLSAICVPGGLDDWFTITYKGKSAGQVHVRSQYTPDQAGGNPQAQAQGGYPQMP